MATDPVFYADTYARSCEAEVLAINDRGGVVLDRTVFYPTGGGQPGDTGVLRTTDGATVAIATTVKGEQPGEIVHVPAEGDPGSLAPGSKVMAEIDWERRHRLMRIHTCLHLLSAVLPYPVTGGQVGDGKGRLDFDIPEAGLDKDEITGRLNELVEADHPVSVRWITDDELQAKPELVKTMSVKPPMGTGRVRVIDIDGLDLQPCGGTHVARTSEIGSVVVRKIEKKGRQNRRVSI
ncbi:MAG: alanyl-tRNA editing protein, partial [Alphaproteobacteria bacterium]